MLSFLLSEVAFFGTLLVSYLYYLSEIHASEPNPREVLELPLALIGTACLLSSSVTVHLADRAFPRGGGAFLGWWCVTMILGAAFLGVTGYEWSELIGRHGLTIDRNIFGSCYFTLVGFHALHVTVGLVVMLLILGLTVRGQIAAKNPVAVELTSWYWHFVDGVWLMVFTVVYLVGR